MKHLLAATAVLVAAPAVARADQCQLFTDGTVQAKVRAIVDKPMKYAELCEPCGEKVPGLPFTPSHAKVTDELFLDGKGYDLAYLYVQTSPTRFENMAMLVGCPVHDVSPSLHVEAETADGVLITADSTPVNVVTDPVPVAEVAKPPPAPPSPVLPQPNITNHYSTTFVYAFPWFAIAAAAGGLGFVLGIAATLIVLSLRRRRAMEPRASRLSA